MAGGTIADFIIYDEQVQAGMYEGVSQSLNIFNAASAGTIRLSSKSHKGNYAKEALFQMISNLISRRDPESTSTVDYVKPTQAELIGVKTKGRIGPIKFTEDEIRAIEMSYDEFSFILGLQIGQAKAQDLVNMAIAAVEAALQGQSDLNYSALSLSVKTLRTIYLSNAMAKMGDRGQTIAAWVMHSKQYYDLVGDQIAEQLTGMSDRIVYGGTPATLGRPVVISDDPALINDVASTDTYQVLGLVPGAVSVEESEQSMLAHNIVTGEHNLSHVLQGEYATTVKLKGMKWNTASGAAPSNAALATPSNWVKVAASLKDLPGVRIAVQ